MIDKITTSSVCGKRGNMCFEKELNNYQVGQMKKYSIRKLVQQNINY
jgi:hypothetical protein